MKQTNKADPETLCELKSRCSSKSELKSKSWTLWMEPVCDSDASNQACHHIRWSIRNHYGVKKWQ